MTSRSHAHPLRRALAPSWPRPGWTGAGALALLCSTVAWASFPASLHRDDDSGQWRALAIAPLAGGGTTGMQMAPTAAALPLDYVAKRAPAPLQAAPEV